MIHNNPNSSFAHKYHTGSPSGNPWSSASSDGLQACLRVQWNMSHTGFHTYMQAVLGCMTYEPAVIASQPQYNYGDATILGIGSVARSRNEDRAYNSDSVCMDDNAVSASNACGKWALIGNSWHRHHAGFVTQIGLSKNNSIWVK